MSSFSQNVNPNAAKNPDTYKAAYQEGRERATNLDTGNSDAYNTGYQQGRNRQTDFNTVGGVGGYSGADIDVRQHDQTSSTGAYTGTTGEPATTGAYVGGQDTTGNVNQTSTWDDTRAHGTSGVDTTTGTADQPAQTASAHRPSTGEKVKGNLEKMAGKLTGDPSKVAHGDNLAHGRNL